MIADILTKISRMRFETLYIITFFDRDVSRFQYDQSLEHTLIKC